MDLITMLQDTLQVCKNRQYHLNGKSIPMKLDPAQLSWAYVFLPEELNELTPRNKPPKGRSALFFCENCDSFTLARKMDERWRSLTVNNPKKVLVLNLANPFTPGGGVRQGARAQEEDLCRKSSLLLSLESPDAQRYYQYNRSRNSWQGTDAILFSPSVEIIKDETGNLLEDSVVVSVMSCAAPIYSRRTEQPSQEEYENLLLSRIHAMLKCAALCGYESLVLGAFGCGAFGNDARIVSDMFAKALDQLWQEHGGSYFESVVFAVLDRTPEQYNFTQFCRNFQPRQEKEETPEMEDATRDPLLDKIQGCLLGGAAGDSLGYAIEFDSEERIFRKYGPDGITSYALRNGKALISDDTQMTLFTANGLLHGYTRCMEKGIGDPLNSVYSAYQGWLRTQKGPFAPTEDLGKKGHCWLSDVPELFALRAPGNTCLSALGGQTGTIAQPCNNSKGCGGVMRVAPVALIQGTGRNFLQTDREAAEIAAITHGHPLGYISAAALCHIIHRLISSGSSGDLKMYVVESAAAIQAIFPGKDSAEMSDLLLKAILLSENGKPDLENIHDLGEGWVGDEALAIAVYCSLRHKDDFSAGIIAAVNHRGDSDSTGAITGNILGALHGLGGIEQKWKQDLELSDVILEIGQDLFHGVNPEKHSLSDPDWVRKYGECRR